MLDFNIVNFMPRPDYIMRMNSLARSVVARFTEELSSINSSQQPHLSQRNFITHEKELINGLGRMLGTNLGLIAHQWRPLPLDCLHTNAPAGTRNEIRLAGSIFKDPSEPLTHSPTAPCIEDDFP